MEERKNIKGNVWIYAVILFTSAFLVLLFTAYVQIKQQKSLNDYKYQLSQQQSENKNIQLSYSNAQKLISELTAENEELKTENSNLKESAENLNRQLEELEAQSRKLKEQYETFTEAQSEYIKGNILDSALLLKKLDRESLEEKLKEEYDYLSGKAFSEAGKQLYDEAYSLYQKSRYTEAIGKFIMSRDIAKNESYSDNCLYYLAYSYYRTGNKERALELMRELVNEYPSSSFVGYANSFIKKHG